MAAPGGSDGPETRNKKMETTLWHDFEAAYQLVTAGRHDVKNFHQYLVDRAKVEEYYADSLEKLSKKHDFEVKNSLEPVWNAIRDATRSMAQQHRQMGSIFGKEIGKLLDAKLKEIKKAKTQVHDAWSKNHKEREKRTSKHKSAQQRYQTAIRDAETAVINRDNGLQGQFPPNKMKPLEKAVKNGLKEVKKSHEAYKESVDHLKTAQETYDSQMVEHLSLLEQTERDREAVLTQQFERFRQSHEMMKSALDQIILLVDNTTKGIDVNRDIQEFIAEHEAKEDPPPHVEFVHIESPIIEHAMGGGSGPAPKASAAAAAAPPASTAKPPANAKSSAPAEVKANAPGKNAKTPGGKTEYAVALYDFEAAEPTDLAFKAGDKIKILEQDDANWWKGELNGKTGTFPSNYVELASSAGNTSESAQPVQLQGKCEALYDFEAAGDDELSFKQGDILSVTGELNGWYLGRSATNDVGIFPSNYVKML